MEKKSQIFALLTYVSQPSIPGNRGLQHAEMEGHHVGLGQTLGTSYIHTKWPTFFTVNDQGVGLW